MFQTLSITGRASEVVCRLREAHHTHINITNFMLTDWVMASYDFTQRTLGYSVYNVAGEEVLVVNRRALLLPNYRALLIIISDIIADKTLDAVFQASMDIMPGPYPTLVDVRANRLHSALCIKGDKVYVATYSWCGYATHHIYGIHHIDEAIHFICDLVESLPF